MLEIKFLFFIQLSAILIVVGALGSINYRLPTDVVPSAYNLTIRPYLRFDAFDKQFTFDGEVSIDITSRKALDEIILHSKNINYTKMEIWEKTKPDQIQEILNSTIDPVTEKMKLKLNDTIVPGRDYQLRLAYIGEINNDTVGFFYSSYTDNENNVRWIGATKFKPHHARRVLPCFDEPSFRATFQVTIIRHKNFKTVSNTRMTSSNLIAPDTYSDIYERSAPMSTYNLAFLISELAERGNENFKIVAQPKYLRQTNYSFEIGQKLLLEFDKYLSMPYYGLGVTKLDLAAITDFEGDFAENWGLLTFSESHLLSDDDHPTSLARINVATNIAFQLAQMWFGNLLTCEWWNYAWMNEGFASYFANMLTAAIYPEWELEKHFVVHQLQFVLAMDSSEHSHPLNYQTDGNPEHLEGMFDEIVYKKSSSVIRMIRHAMGEEAFRASLLTYLNEFKYKTVVPGNLLKHWQTHWPNDTKEYASKVFDSFTNQSGYPLITFNVSDDGSRMEISQKHFGSNNRSNDSLLYTVPLTYTTSKEMNFNLTKPKFYLQAKSNSTIIDLPSVDWVIANVQQTGYYRVNYNEKNWHNIHEALMQSNWSDIHEINRAQIVNDLLSLARLGEISYSLALKCLEYLKTEISYTPWSAAFYGYTPLIARLGSVHKKIFNAYMVRLTDGIFQHLGFEDRKTDSTLDIFNRKNVISWACLHGNQECIRKALTYFDAMETTPVPVNLRFPIYCTAMMHATSEEKFNKMLNKYHSTTDRSDKSVIFCSLGCVTNARLIENYLKIIMSNEIPRHHKAGYLIWFCDMNPSNVSPVFKFIINNFDELTEILGSNYEISKIIYQIADKFTNENQKNDLEKFIQIHKAKLEDSSIVLLNEACRIVEQNLLWDLKHLDEIVEHLSSHS